MAIFSSDDEIKYVVEIMFGHYYCGIRYLTPIQKRTKTEAYVKHQGGLFLREKAFHHENGGAKITYLYETDGKYRKTLFNEEGEIIEQTFETIDVTSHFRNRINLGEHYSSCPKDE